MCECELSISSRCRRTKHVSIGPFALIAMLVADSVCRAAQSVPARAIGRVRTGACVAYVPSLLRRGCMHLSDCALAFGRALSRQRAVVRRSRRAHKRACRLVCLQGACTHVLVRECMAVCVCTRGRPWVRARVPKGTSLAAYVRKRRAWSTP
eukprot:6192782-Pleurochrysis_carterae.AAC.2